MHARLREALAVTQDALADGERADAASRDLLLFCRGFCTALTGQHEGEDRMLFPALVEAHPELGDTIRKLMQDHSMISHLIGGLQSVISSGTTAGEPASHLEGISAIIESHFPMRSASCSPYSTRSPPTPTRCVYSGRCERSADRRSMISDTTCHKSISLDGFVAGPDQRLENPLGIGGIDLHRWHIGDPRATDADETASSWLGRPRGA